MKKIILITILSLVLNCNVFSTKKDDNSKTTLLAFLLLSDKYNSTCTTTFGTGVADWVKNSFTCVTVSVSGNNYVFKTSSIPTYKSYYWGSTSSGYESSLYTNSTKSNYGNPNLISAQNYSFTLNLNTTSTTAPTSSMGAIGVSANGIVIYNDQAAPGDSLVSEYYTFDTSQGHPTNTGSYHYHVDPLKITGSSNTAFVGLGLDGYPIFGKYHNSSDTSSTNNTSGFSWSSSNIPNTGSTTACSSTPNDLPSDWSQLANYRSSTFHNNSNSKHYHVKNGTEVNALIMSATFIGAAGTLSQ
jgi:hypothetical protein